jgi:hypothetical protein
MHILALDGNSINARGESIPPFLIFNGINAAEASFAAW